MTFARNCHNEFDSFITQHVIQNKSKTICSERKNECVLKSVIRVLLYMTNSLRIVLSKCSNVITCFI